MRRTKEQNTNKGITLIALVITIIVMLILVAVTITMAVNGGLFDYARKAGQATNGAVQDEQVLANGTVEVDGLWYNTMNDYIAENPVPTEEDFFEIDEETGTVSIVADTSENHDGIGYFYDQGSDEAASLSATGIAIPETIDGTEVKIIGEAMCAYAPNLKTVVMPNTVTTIEDRAFKQTGLRRVTIPENVTSIGDYAFWKCTELKEVIMTSTSKLETIEFLAFARCTNLRKVTLPNSLTLIEGGAFFECDSLEEVNLPNSVTEIEEGAFSYCDNLKKVTLSSGLTEIGTRIFYECKNLSDITISNSVTYIGRLSFGSCTGLTQIKIPSSVTEIHEEAFDECTNLTKIILEEGSTLTVPANKWGATNATVVTK